MSKKLIKLAWVHVPIEHFGALWLFFEEHPGIQFKYEATPAQSKRLHGKVSEGSTGKCIILGALADYAKNKSGPVDSPQLKGLLVAAGKSTRSLGGIMHDLKKAKHVRKIGKLYSITAAGVAFHKENCVKE